MSARAVLLLVLAAATAGCSTYRDQLARGQVAFDANEHERTLALLRDLEPDLARLSPQEQARYAYLRGMSDYRIGHKADARHWLLVAEACEESTPGALPVDWKAHARAAVTELNAAVYAERAAAASE